MRWLAINKAKPTTPKSQKRGWEAIGRIFYGYLDPKLFTTWAMPAEDGSKFEGSTRCSFFHGACACATRSRHDRRLEPQ